VQAEFGFKPNPKMADTLKAAFDAGIPFIVLFGNSVSELHCWRSYPEAVHQDGLCRLLAAPAWGPDFSVG